MKSTKTTTPNIRQLVLNWHLTETCNYSCRYCYSSWHNQCHNAELSRNSQTSSLLLRELYRFFNPENSTNQLQQSFKWTSVRLSLAGGEPLLYPERILRKIEEAKVLGFSLSLITNGSLLTDEIITPLAANLSMLGISVDSSNPRINQNIGRQNRAGKTLCLNDLAQKLSLGRTINPELVIKINTVVNAENVNEDLTPMINLLQPDKWKVLRVLPVITTDLSITDEQFQSFVDRHRSFGSVLSAEDNQDMTESYIMVDPFGRFFQNHVTPAAKNPYVYSEPILKVGADQAFAQINFNADRFSSRYCNLKAGELA